jgi:hypothetical protein
VGHQLFSTVYEDTASERTGSFVTAHSVAGDLEDTETHAGVDFRGPSGSTTLALDPYTDSDRASIPFTTTPPSGSSGAQARPRPSGNNNNNSGSGTSDTFALRRLTFGSALSRPSFSAARAAALARLPPLPILLFWVGFIAPWCWLIGGWLIAEGRWEENGKARAALPLWRPRRRRRRPPQSKGKSASVGDLEKGAGTAGAKKKEGEEEGVGDDASPMRPWWACWNPFATHGASPPSGDGGAEKVVTFVKPYSAEVWVYRCRLAAVISALMLLTALIVTLVIVGSSGQ